MKKFIGLKDPKTESEAISKFREALIQKNKILEEKIREVPDLYIKNIANKLMKYIFSLEEMKNVSFFFVSPVFSKDKFENYLKSHGIKKEYIGQTIQTFLKNMETQNINIDPNEINKKCSEILYKNCKILSHNDVFKFLKYVLSGCETPLLFSEVCEILGKEKIIERLKAIEEMYKMDK